MVKWPNLATEGEDTEIEIFCLSGDTNKQKYSVLKALRRKSSKMDINYLTGQIIRGAIEVHKTLGPGPL